MEHLINDLLCYKIKGVLKVYGKLIGGNWYTFNKKIKMNIK